MESKRLTTKRRGSSGSCRRSPCSRRGLALSLEAQHVVVEAQRGIVEARHGGQKASSGVVTVFGGH
jgi:hypothetical protein